MSQQAPPAYPRHYGRNLPGSLHTRSRSSSIESQPRGRTLRKRRDSNDSLHIPMDIPTGPIQRWDGINREATEWNALRRDPELFLLSGNCLVYLYGAGTSQRGPSFRIPYDLLLYSGCRPLVDQCLMSSLSVSPYHPASTTPPSYDVVDYPMSNEENCSYLFLQAPSTLPRDESYMYHLTTRNFFAWLMGVPLVGTDPVSALLDLKVRMDMWRDPGSGNFGALFDYVREQNYGDFEALEIEMGKRLNGDFGSASGMTGFAPAGPMIYREPSNQQVDVKLSRRASLTQKLKRKLSRTRVASQDRRENPPAPTQSEPARVAQRVQTLRMNSFHQEPSAPNTDDMYVALQGSQQPASTQPVPIDEARYAALRRLTGPSSTHSVDVVSSPRASSHDKIRRRVSWANGAPASAVSVTQTPSSAYLMAVESSVSASASVPTLVEKKIKHRLSWTSISARLAGPLELRREDPTAETQTSNLPLQAPQPQRPFAVVSEGPIQQQYTTAPTSRAQSVAPPEEKRKRRLSWTSLRGRSGQRRTAEPDVSIAPMLPPSSSTTGQLAGSPLDTALPYAAIPAPGVEKRAKRRLSWASITRRSRDKSISRSEANIPPVSDSKSSEGFSRSVGAEAAGSNLAGPSTDQPPPRSESRNSVHPSIRDPKTGEEVCACCGKRRQPRNKLRDVQPGPSNAAGPFKSARPSTDAGPSTLAGPSAAAGPSKLKKNPTKQTSFNEKMSRRRKAFRNRFHKEIIIPDYGNGLVHDKLASVTNGVPAPVPRETAQEPQTLVSDSQIQSDSSIVASPTAMVPELDPSPSSPDSIAFPQRSLGPSMVQSGKEALLPLPQTSNSEQFEPNVSIVNSEFEDNIDALLGQLEAAGISEKAKGRSRRDSMVSLDSRSGVPRLEVHGMA